MPCPGCEALSEECDGLRAQLAEAQKTYNVNLTTMQRERDDYRRLAQQAKADREEELLGVIWEAKEAFGCIPGNTPKSLLQVCQEVLQQLAEAKQALDKRDQYVSLYSKEVFGTRYSYGVKILVDVGRTITEFEKIEGYKAMDLIETAILTSSALQDETSVESGRAETLQLTNLFPRRVYVEKIPNGYCSRGCCVNKPWLIVTTQVGRIKIGWRKSVINIDWSDSAIKRRGRDIFPDVDVTVGDHHIHAYGYEQANGFIKVLLYEDINND